MSSRPPMPAIHSTSRFHSPKEPKFIAAAEFESFAPAPCVCCGCCITDVERERTYAHIYENHIDINIPVNPCCCFGSDFCTQDIITKSYFDHPPHRVGWGPGCCCCIPCFCCGSPAIYEDSCSCCCINCDSWCGVPIFASPCDCFGMRSCLVCGTPCYKLCGIPIIPSTKNTLEFLSQYRRAVRLYFEKHELPKGQSANFYTLTHDGCCGLADMVPEAAAPAGESMDRGDGRPKKVKTVKASVYGNEQ
jgi:hypothetical protein